MAHSFPIRASRLTQTLRSRIHSDVSHGCPHGSHAWGGYRDGATGAPPLGGLLEIRGRCGFGRAKAEHNRGSDGLGQEPGGRSGRCQSRCRKIGPKGDVLSNELTGASHAASEAVWLPLAPMLLQYPPQQHERHWATYTVRRRGNGSPVRSVRTTHHSSALCDPLTYRPTSYGAARVALPAAARARPFSILGGPVNTLASCRSRFASERCRFGGSPSLAALRFQRVPRGFQKAR
jgi:hypothetical protein